MSGPEAFSPTYTRARDSFIASAAEQGGRLSRWVDPGATGPEGEALTIDVARFGASDAATVLMICSGTHGIEGYAGSAVQTAWLRDGFARRVPDGSAVVLVHAVNPWGFAHGQRATASNVDLNRNFVDFGRPLRANPGYAELHPRLCLDEWTDAAVARVFAALEVFRHGAGEQAFSDAFNGGQHTHPDGLFYGGQSAEWSNLAWRDIVAQQAGRARRVALVDLHTGIGPYGQPFFANFDAKGTPSRARAQRWWGERAVNRAGLTHAAFASYSGVLIDALAPALPHADCTTIVVEFGTLARPLMQRAHLGLMWRRRHPDLQGEVVEQLRRDYREAFCPADTAWRSSVLNEGRTLLDQALAGLSDW